MRKLDVLGLAVAAVSLASCGEQDGATAPPDSVLTATVPSVTVTDASDADVWCAAIADFDDDPRLRQYEALVVASPAALTQDVIAIRPLAEALDDLAQGVTDDEGLAEAQRADPSISASMTVIAKYTDDNCT